MVESKIKSPLITFVKGGKRGENKKEVKPLRGAKVIHKNGDYFNDIISELYQKTKYVLCTVTKIVVEKIKRKIGKTKPLFRISRIKLLGVWKTGRVMRYKKNVDIVNAKEERQEIVSEKEKMER